jgi:hypothetical protein
MVVRDICIARKQFGVKLFHFTDDALSVDQGCAIANQLRSCCSDVRWLTYAKAGDDFSKEVFDLWYAGGCRVIEWGFESGSQAVLDRMDKGVRLDSVIQAIKLASQAGIVNKLFAFHDYPGETTADLCDTLAILSELATNKEIRLFFPVRNKCELLWGSALFDQSALRLERIFDRVRVPRGRFSIRAEGITKDAASHAKHEMLERFGQSMTHLQSQRRIYSTDDDNVTLDLLTISLQESGIETKYKAM